jgi:hypothetical protein
MLRLTLKIEESAIVRRENGGFASVRWTYCLGMFGGLLRLAAAAGP